MCLWIPKRCLKSHLVKGRVHMLHDTTLASKPRCCSACFSESQSQHTRGVHALQSTLTLAALAWFLGGTFSFCDRRRTEDLPVSSGVENRKSQHSELFSLGMFSSFKICRLILGKQYVLVTRSTMLQHMYRYAPQVRQGDSLFPYR